MLRPVFRSKVCRNAELEESVTLRERGEERDVERRRGGDKLKWGWKTKWPKSIRRQKSRD